MTTTRSGEELMGSMRIPSLSASVLRIRSLLASPDVGIPKVVEAFLSDPPLAARAIKIANSVHYGLCTKTTSIHMAVSVLGLRTLSEIVLHAGVLSALADVTESDGFSPQDMWKHSILTATISEALASRCRGRLNDLLPQDYYTCGLLHDLGKIVLYDNLGEEYVSVVRRACIDKISLEAEESRHFGMSHAEVGSVAALLWKLPEPIAGVIRFHHRPSAHSGMVDVVKLVTCADEIANAIAAAPLAGPNLVLAEVRTHPGGLSERDMLQIIEDASASWEEIGK